MSFPGGASDDRLHAIVHRPPMIELRGEGYLIGAAARWPEPFDDDNLDLPEDEMWWVNS